MRRVIALEFVGLEKLDCDLYDENGNIVYEKGTAFTQELLMKLSHAKIYKRVEDDVKEKPQPAPAPTQALKQKSTQKEGLWAGKKRPLPPAGEPENIPEEAEYLTDIEPEKVREFVNNASEILASAASGKCPDLNLCLDTATSLLKEVYERFDTAENVGNMRINDYYTFTHDVNTALISAIIGRELGYHENKVKDLSMAALLHDIGKMLLPQEVLYKNGKLTPEEFTLIKNHAQLGYDFITNKMNLPDYIAKGALEHHERWNGDGYPNKLKGKEISEFGQIIAIADVYDALVSNKIYKNSMSSNDAIRLMLTEESKSFNPEIFHKFAHIAVVKHAKQKI